MSGACTCGPGWRGTYCEKPCPEGFHGLECNQSCDCGHGILCNAETGVCRCPLGKHGDKCLKSKKHFVINTFIGFYRIG